MHARLIPPEHPMELSVESSLAIYRRSREELIRRFSRFKRRTARHTSRKFERERKRGYSAGFEQGKAAFGEATRNISACYREASNLATHDCQKLALLLADQVIEAHITNHPQSLLTWFHRAALLLRSTASLTLLFHPRLEKLVGEARHLFPPEMHCTVNTSPAAPDFTLVGEAGAVEFSWREALEALTRNAEGT